MVSLTFKHPVKTKFSSYFRQRLCTLKQERLKVTYTLYSHTYQAITFNSEEGATWNTIRYTLEQNLLQRKEYYKNIKTNTGNEHSGEGIEPDTINYLIQHALFSIKDISLPCSLVRTVHGFMDRHFNLFITVLLEVWLALQHADGNHNNQEVFEFSNYFIFKLHEDLPGRIDVFYARSTKCNILSIIPFLVNIDLLGNIVVVIGRVT